MTLVYRLTALLLMIAAGATTALLVLVWWDDKPLNDSLALANYAINSYAGWHMPNTEVAVVAGSAVVLALLGLIAAIRPASVALPVTAIVFTPAADRGRGTSCRRPSVRLPNP